MKIDLRPLLPSDEPFLWEMLYLALYVPPGQAPFPRAILDDPDIACYVKGWGRAGDWGLLAVDGENQVGATPAGASPAGATPAAASPAGAVWLRQWPEDGEKGYGYVSPQIPEISLALLPEYRNQGLGRRILETVILQAKPRYPGLSLSVVESSPARRLYERLGFRKVGKIMESLVMLMEWKNVP